MSAPQLTNYIPYQSLYEAALRIVNLIDKSLENGDMAFGAFVASHPQWNQALIDLQDCVSRSSEAITDREIYAKEIKEARSNYASDDLEIDDYPSIALAPEGVWVSAWVYVATGEDNCLEDADEDY